MNRFTLRHRAAVLALVVGCMIPNAASAQDAAARRFMFGAGLGGSFGLNNGLRSQFKLEEFIGYAIVPVHEHPGFFIEGVFAQGVVDYARLTWAARFGFGIQVYHHQDFEVIITPHFQLGGTGMFFNGDTEGAFNMNIGAQAEMAFLRGMLAAFLRPLSFDFNIGRDAWVYYELMTGVVVRL